jgi:ATP-binding protein involved in chromosome partitioning
MKIAIPIAEGRLCQHFGHCETFALFDADPESKTILGRKDLEPPPHEPGVLPAWLAGLGATHIIAGGMGQRAQTLFVQQGVQVIVGAPADEPESLVTRYLAGTLTAGVNACDH